MSNAQFARQMFGWISGVSGLMVASSMMRPSPAASVSGHARVLLVTLVPAAVSVAFAKVLLGRAGTILATMAALLFVWIVLFHPVSDRIPDEDVATFETVHTLQERAAQGEPFRQMQGHWYQVKPWIARLLFF
jgi:hypothetical protein